MSSFIKKPVSTPLFNKGNLFKKVLSPLRELIKRYFTTFDPVAQTYVQLSKPITLTGDFEFECEYSTPATAGDLCFFSDTAGDNFARLDASNNGYDIKIGGVFYANDNSFTLDSKLNHVKFRRESTNLTIEHNGVVVTTHVVGTDAVEIANIGFRDGAFPNPFNGILANVKVQDAGTTVLDMPLDGSDYESNAIVANKQTALGANEFAPSTQADWVDNGDGSYTKPAGASGLVGEFYTDGTLQANTAYLVEFTLEADVDTLNIFTRDGGTNVALATSLGTGNYGLVLETGDGGGLWFARSPFGGTLSNVSFKEIPVATPLGTAVNFTATDSEIFTFDSAGDRWVGAENWTNTGTTLGDGWQSLGGGVYYCDGSQTGASNLQEAYKVGSDIGSTFIHAFTINSVAAGAAKRLTGGGTPNGASQNAVGTYTETFQITAASSSFGVQSDSDFAGQISGVSLRKVIEVA